MTYRSSRALGGVNKKRIYLLKEVRKWLSSAKPVMPDAGKVEAYTEHRQDQLNKAKALFETDGKKYELLSVEDYLPNE